MPEFSPPIVVSILLAARNEQANIERCLNSLAALNYPVEKIEICIGDDDSTDDTAKIIHNFIGPRPQFKYYKISSTINNLKGKANVIAQLAAQAKGDFFFFCDADITVQPDWVTNMLAEFGPGTGIVTGMTRMKKSHLLADFLSLEWLFALTVMKICSFLKIPVTGLGNNMAVSRKAYFATGGFEKIGFSIVEDYSLFMAIVAKGFDFTQAYDSNVLSVSEPVNSLKELRFQRKRWMRGVMQSTFLTRFSIIVSAGLIPFFLILAIWQPEMSGLMLLIHYCIVTIAAISSIIILRQTDLWKTVFFFWFYMFAHATVMLVNYLRPGKMTWKGRDY